MPSFLDCLSNEGRANFFKVAKSINPLWSPSEIIKPPIELKAKMESEDQIDRIMSQKPLSKGELRDGETD